MILLHAWIRRKRFEARLLAVEVGKLFGSPTGGRPLSGKGDGWVSPDTMLDMLGVNL